LPWNKIVWLKSDRVYQEIVMEDGRKWMVRQSLTESMRDLPPHFFRVHRSYVVNLHYLESIGLNEVNIHGHQIPISRKLREELLAELGLKER
jgi:DNA-binding LytR/AlgR family response regulator